MRWIEPGDPLRPTSEPLPASGPVAWDEVNWHESPAGNLCISPRTGGWATFDPRERAMVDRTARVEDAGEARPLVEAAWRRALITVAGASVHHADEHAQAVARTRDYYTLVLLLNSGCNLACSYCYLGHATPTRARAMELDHARGAIHAALAQPWPTVLIDFGEIAVAEGQFRSLLVWAEQEADRAGKRLRTSVQTNATTLGDEFADFLAAHRVSVGISLDGPQDIHDDARRFRTGAGSYDRAVAAISRCRDRAVPVHLIATVTRRAIGRTADVLGEIGRHRPNSFLVKPVLAQGEAATAWTQEGMSTADFDRFMTELVTIADRDDAELLDQSAGKFLLRLLGDSGGWRDSCTSRYCGSGRSLHVVSADGGLHACPRFVTERPARSQPVLLQITTRPASAAQASDILLRDLLPDALRRPPSSCDGCSWLGSCGGGCTLAGQAGDRAAPLPDPHCASYIAIHSALFRTIIPSFLDGRHQRSRMFNGARRQEVTV